MAVKGLRQKIGPGPHLFRQGHCVGGELCGTVSEDVGAPAMGWAPGFVTRKPRFDSGRGHQVLV